MTVKKANAASKYSYCVIIYYAKTVHQSASCPYTYSKNSRQKKPEWATTSAEIRNNASDGQYTLRPLKRSYKWQWKDATR